MSEKYELIAENNSTEPAPLGLTAYLLWAHQAVCLQAVGETDQRKGKRENPLQNSPQAPCGVIQKGREAVAAEAVP